MSHDNFSQTAAAFDKVLVEIMLFVQEVHL